MEYIQTILFQIPASRLEEASQAGGLLPELDEHRNFLKGQTGFRDLRITRSINNEGNVLVVVETRWTDDASLVRYETNEPNAASIVRKHRDIIVPDSLQVLDMEALRTETSFRRSEEVLEARSRTVLPIVIPLGVLAFILLSVYGLSRIYLEIRGDGAVALATGLAIGVLLIAAYFAANPRVPGWQIGGVVTLLALTLAGGTVWAVANEDEKEAHDGGGAVESPTAAPGGETPAPDGLVITMGDNFFEFNGERNPTITITAGEETVFTLPNEGIAIHNARVTGEDNEYDTDDDIVSDPDVVRGGQEATLTVNLPAGEYDFRCDFHPTEMTGTLIAE